MYQSGKEDEIPDSEKEQSEAGGLRCGVTDIIRKRPKQRVEPARTERKENYVKAGKDRKNKKKLDRRGWG